MENITNYLVKQLPLEKPLVSVIMTVNNKENTIVNFIMSVLNQTCENIELIIVDNGSTDNTYTKIKQINDNRIKLLNNKEIQNKSIIRNKALKKKYW